MSTILKTVHLNRGASLMLAPMTSNSETSNDKPRNGYCDNKHSTHENDQGEATMAFAMTLPPPIACHNDTKQ